MSDNHSDESPSLFRSMMLEKLDESTAQVTEQQAREGDAPVGFITSPTSTRKCEFAVFESMTELVYEGQLLVVKQNGEKIIGLVTNLFESSRGSSTGVMNYFSVLYGSLPTLEQSLRYGEMQIYGNPTFPGTKRIFTPPTPYSPIYVSIKEDYEAIFKDPARHSDYYTIGTIRGTNYPVDLDAAAILRMGVGIFARIGMGKSITAGINLLGLGSLSKKVNVIVWDHTGEYSTSNLSETLGNRFDTMSTRELPMIPANSTDIIKSLGFDVLPTQARKAVEIAAEIFMLDFIEGRVSMNIPAFMDYVIPWLDEFYKRGNSISSWTKAICRRLEALGSDLFNGGTINSYKEVWKKVKNKILVIDASHEPLEARQSKLGTIASHILHHRYPIQLIVDEAKNYVPETGGSFYNTIVGKPFLSSGKLINLSEEGRKFGSNLTIINQRVSRISKAVFSNLNTLFCGCLTAASDIKAIENYTDFPEIKGILPRLGIGEFLVAGMATPLKEPLVVEIDKGELELGFGGKSVFELHKNIGTLTREKK
ncbi:MAG: DUF87 domain-containing protein [Candidatus Heimdallarchaeota archaeon]|nr:DUF87 domain-containing protein [Candidatus Heimdallarchaeota archaeon]